MFAANLRASWASSWQKTNIICSSCKCLQTVRCMRGDEAYRHLLHGKQVANSLRRKGNSEYSGKQITNSLRPKGNSEYSEKEIGMRPQRKENSEHSGKQIAISAYSVKGIANIVGRTANTGEKTANITTVTIWASYITERALCPSSGLRHPKQSALVSPSGPFYSERRHLALPDSWSTIPINSGLMDGISLSAWTTSCDYWTRG